MEKVFFTDNDKETIALGKEISKYLKKGDVIILDGDLGCGKTTLTKGIGLGLGVDRIINSPTFTILKIYHGSKLDLFHLDLYRLNGLNNDFDLEDYIYTDGVCVIEWPYQVKELIPEVYLLVKLERLGENERKITIISNFKEFDSLVGDLSC